MQALQREHIHAVMALAGEGLPLPAALTPDAIIRESWARCVHEYRLDPTRMQEAVILPHAQLREHQDRLDEFLRIARHGLESLYRQVAGMGYCVLLTDARGVTVDFIGDLQLDTALRRAGLYLGSDWSEHHAGTCGVGTAITTGQALTVHQGDHFDATHIPLTCTAAPVYDPLGNLTAILDISALVSPQEKASQGLALQLINVYAHWIENANFLRWFRNDWVLKLHPSPEFVEITPDFLIALDASGRVIGHNRAAQHLLEAELSGREVSVLALPADDLARPATTSGALGLAFDRLFNARFVELGRFLRAMPGEGRAVTLAASGRVLFLQAVPPPARALAADTPAHGEPAVPAPLAALSGGDALLDKQIRNAARLMNSPVSILITGETGTGKEYFAKALHAASERRGKPFVAVNCAAIPETLIESELFGYLPGSFSGAGAKGKRGLIAEADGGTLFLDEIGDMPLALQARLLRVLAEREVLPVGATRTQRVDIRVIAATQVELESRVREGRFRDDLFYRLNGAHFKLPPLRQRSDLVWLTQRLLREGAQGEPPALAPEIGEWLRAYPWPGNLRELSNALQYARAVCTGGTITLADLPDALQPRAADGRVAAMPAEAQLLVQYLRAAQWNVSAVAHKLGVARMTLYRRMKRWGIHAPNREG